MINGINEKWLKKGHVKLIDFLRSLGMSELTGKVKEIFEGKVASGRSAGDPFWTITLEDDSKLTCFFEGQKQGWIDGLEADKEYTFIVKVSGDYINIAGQTAPCIDQSAEEKPSKPIKVVAQRKPPVVTSTIGGERVAKNAISALQASVTFIAGALGGTATKKDVMEQADEFFKWINDKMSE